MIFIVSLLVSFLSKIASHIHIHCLLKLRVLLNDVCHKIVFLILQPYFTKVYNNVVHSKLHKYPDNSGVIWIFWWQGYTQMPRIVKCCIRSIIFHSNGHRVIVVSRNNIKHYTDIPIYIYKKLAEGYITFTHFSDIVRFNLLNKYGGLWIDSTIYCVSNLNSEYFGRFYTSGPGGKNVNTYHDFVSDKWTGFLIGGCKGNPIFKFMDDFFKLYWRYNNHLIAYFLIDYALYYVYIKNIGNFNDYVNCFAYKHNPKLHTLMNYLNKPFDLNKYKDMTHDTDLFKLTYKESFDTSNNTFYNRLIGYK